MKIYTENSVYEFNTLEKLCRRIRTDIALPLRKDEEWTKYLTVHYEIGDSMRIILEHLGGDSQQITLRTTSFVLKVED